MEYFSFSRSLRSRINLEIYYVILHRCHRYCTSKKSNTVPNILKYVLVSRVVFRRVYFSKWQDKLYSKHVWNTRRSVRHISTSIDCGNRNENAKLNINRNKFDYSNRFIRRGDGVEVVRRIAVRLSLQFSVEELWWMLGLKKIYYLDTFQFASWNGMVERLLFPLGLWTCFHAKLNN